MQIFKKIFFTLILILPLQVFAAPTTAATDLAQILNNLHTLQAQFSQTVSDGQGQVMQQTSGEMALERPGKFRWDTQNPSKQLLVADGQKVWLYDTDLQQVTVQKQRADNSNSPAMLLNSSTATLSRDFIVDPIKSNDGNTRIFQLKPRKNNGLFQSVQLTFKNNGLQQMRMLDNLGQETSIVFSQVKLNPALNPNLFHFVTPKGVDVVNS